MSVLSDESKRSLVDKIISSSVFKNAPTSSGLLRYLVEAHIGKRSLKEGIIDIEFFNGRPDIDKSNPRVRVNIYNLRKKLGDYYVTEGADDSVRLVIEKGQYDVTFQHSRKKGWSPVALKRNGILPYLLVVVLGAMLLVDVLPAHQPPIWKPFFRNDQQTNLYIGDAFGVTGKTITQGYGWTRDYQINSLEEYYELVERKPELKGQIEPVDFNYSTRMAEHATHSLARYFTEANAEFEIRYASRASYADIKSVNAIYVGRLNNQEKFTEMLHKHTSKVRIANGKLMLKNIEGLGGLGDTTIFTATNATYTDHAVVARMPGLNGTEQFYFFSNHDIGVMATVEYFTNPDSIASFTNRYLNDGHYFVAVFRANGRERVNFELTPICVTLL
ncbi:hypothetical protein [Marinoscillum furvescens]|uniref:Uncharacterized protein n=1 Tax=Marinoscillum furvescens DSM 4134 TaxID=1122208 RepID=A0A3D9KZU3_MARFU|nr:hypothetical protein [Marinoscillum furvescens]RED95944.1 hypothetical protein C7460_1162 [Marinoscillum furvescens DSM 4134]